MKRPAIAILLFCAAMIVIIAIPVSCRALNPDPAATADATVAVELWLAHLGEADADVHLDDAKRLGKASWRWITTAPP